jgi:hypothetical protein
VMGRSLVGPGKRRESLHATPDDTKFRHKSYFRISFSYTNRSRKRSFIHLDS